MIGVVTRIRHSDCDSDLTLSPESTSYQQRGLGQAPGLDGLTFPVRKAEPASCPKQLKWAEWGWGGRRERPPSRGSFSAAPPSGPRALSWPGAQTRVWEGSEACRM